MARPFVPDLEKKRTVPLRLTKPQYRALSLIIAITGDTIQELLRTGATQVIASKRKEIETAGVPFPSELALGVLSDEQFQALVDNPGTPTKEPERKKRPFGTRPAQAAA